MLIANREVDSVSGETIDVVNPSDGQAFGKIWRGTSEDVDAAVGAAQKALDGAWGRLSAWDRGRLLLKAAQAIADHSDELVAIECADTGKTLSQAKADISVAIRYFEYYGGLAGKLDGDTIPFEPGFMAMTVREPFGVTGHILPWNYPAQMFARDAAAALAAGNAMVMKPAEDACQSPLAMAKILVAAGLPEGAMNVVTGLGDEAGAALSRHPGVEHLSFTGSPEVGAKIQIEMARRNRGCTMELGGKSPQLLFADADLEAAIPPIVTSIVMSAGQTCSAGSRVLIERTIYDKAIALLGKAFTDVRVGTPEMDLHCGPVISAKQKARVEDFISRAKDEGVPVVAESSLADGLPSGGFWVKPILFGPVPRGARLACEEVFGPVLSVLPFDDEEDAVRLANATEYGLVANIWTRDGARQLRVARAMRCGQVFVNGAGFGGNVELPFGGVKKSGFGREKGIAALHEYTTLKTILIRHG